jgi:Fe-S-cluster containining protein
LSPTGSPGSSTAEQEPLTAGDFGQWLADTRAAIRGERDADVPCGDCTACCTASQFIHVGPDERETLAVIPRGLLFAAPGFPAGHVLMGYDDEGRCPMFVDGRCSIYENRPRTCRTYDCRIYAATDVVPADPAIAARVRQWEFDHSTPQGVQTHERLKQRAAHDSDPSPTKRAVRAITG